MDRHLLILSTVRFLAAVVRTIVAFWGGTFRPGRFNFFAIGAGFILQTAFLSIRGHAVGRCPLTNLFEVLIFLAWSIALIYMVVGPAYRLSLMGAFTAPLVLIVQGFALFSTPGKMRDDFRSSARNSTAHCCSFLCPELPAKTFSTDPQHSSQQQAL